MHLSQFHASQRSMKFTSNFVWLLIGVKWLKLRRYKLTDRTGIYFSTGFAGELGGG
jgi:hypothetical protein